MIIAITGTLGSGKGTVVEYLKAKGFKHYSASGFITEEILRRGLPVNRDTMTTTGEDLRALHGADYVFRSLLERALACGGDAIIESIRTTGEVASIKANHIMLLGVDADPKIRYERAVARGSEKDNVSFEKFMADEERESVSETPERMNLRKCLALADAVVMNNGTIEELQQQVEKILGGA
ncbi:MAG: hypothetical protein RLZZ283_300 [Candidatus Parcubacteria bacterium]|jgi:dephospho-CoA kinase